MGTAPMCAAARRPSFWQRCLHIRRANGVRQVNANPRTRDEKTLSATILMYQGGVFVEQSQ